MGEFVAAGTEPARLVPGDGGVARVIQTADVTGVLALPDSERKRAFLHLVLRTLDAFFEGATPRAFLDAASDVRTADFVNTWTWQPGTRRSPDRRWRTVVTVLHDLREYQVRLEVLDERALPAYEQVLARGDRPDETIINGHLGELAWDEPCRLVLRPRLPGSAPVVVELPSSFAEARLDFRQSPAA